MPQGIKEESMKKTGDVAVGSFKPRDGKITKIITYSKEGPFIYIITKNDDSKNVIINYVDRKHTEDLYNIILSNVKN